MRRREFLQSLGAASFTASGLAAAPARPPNVILILMDDLGWADTTCYGSTFYETPNIDRLATEGVRFTNAYAACPVCSPTRASIMTGKYPARLGVTNYLPGKQPLPYAKLLAPDSHPQLELSEITLAEALKKGGYATAHVGKWHLGSAPYYPEHQGFDVNIAGSSSGMPRSFFYPQWGDNPPLKGQEGEYLTDRLTDESIGFIRANQNRPFFLYLAHYAVHVPIEAKERMTRKYRDKLRPGQLQNDPVYAAMIESMDESVGRIMKTLDDLKLSENTLIFFTSDNGGLSAPEWKLKPVTSNAPLREGKGHVYEGGIREPLIVRGPGVRPGVVDTPVCSIDFYSTILNLTGVPDDAAHKPDGISFAGVLQRRAALPKRELYWHYPHYSNQLGRPAGAVRQGDYKLIEFYEDGHRELYNLKEDIGETRDLSSKMPAKAGQLQELLRQWRHSVGAKMPVPNPKYDPARESEGYWWKEGTLPK